MACLLEKRSFDVHDSSLIESINLIWLLEKINQQKVILKNNLSESESDMDLDAILDKIVSDMFELIKSLMCNDCEIDDLQWDDNRKFLKDLMQSKLENSNINENFKLLTQIDLIKTKNKTTGWAEISNTYVEDKENINSENFYENTLLRTELQESKFKLANIEKEILSEKNSTELYEMKSYLDQVSRDLEDQINEGFELQAKINDYKKNEYDFQQALFNLVSKSGKYISDSLSISELINILDDCVEKNKDNVIDCPINDVMNESILDLNFFHSETICLKESPNDSLRNKKKSKLAKSKLPKLFPTTRKSTGHNDSFLSLDSFHLNCSIDESFALSNELDKLDWEEIDKMELLVEKSFSIFTQTVINLFNSKDESIIHKLKSSMNEFCQILTSKVKAFQIRKVDLNSTCMFEKLEHELQLETCNAELKEQLKVAFADKANAILDLENEKKENRDLSSKLENYINTISVIEEQNKMFSEKNSNNLELLQNKIDDLKLVNNDLQNALNLSTETVELYEIKLKNYQVEIENIINERNDYILKLKEIEEVKENLKIKSNDLKATQKNLEKLSNLLLEKDQTIDDLKNDLIFSNKKVADLLCDVESKSNKENEYFHMKEQESELLNELLKLKIDNTELQTQLNTRTMELESAVEDYLKISEELDNIKATVPRNEKLFSDSQSEKDKEKEIDEKIKNTSKESEIKELSEKVSILTNEKNSLEKQMENKVIEMAKIKKELEEMILENINNASVFQNEMILIQDEITENRKALHNVINEKKILNNKVDELMSCLKNYENENNLELVEKENVILELKKEIDNKNNELVLIKDKLLFTEEKVINNNNDALMNEAIQNELEIKASELETLKCNLIEFEKTLIENEKKIVMLNEEKLESEVKLQSFVDKLNLSQNSIINNEQEIIILKEEILGLQKKQEESENKIFDFQNSLIELETMKLNLVSKEKELIQSNNQYQMLNEESNLLKEINLTLDSEIKNLNQNFLLEKEKFSFQINCFKTEISGKNEIINQMLIDKNTNDSDLKSLEDQLKLEIDINEKNRKDFELIHNNNKEITGKLEIDLEKSIIDFKTLQNNYLICQNYIKEKENDIKVITEANELIENELMTLKTQLNNLKLELKYKEQELDRINICFKTTSTELIVMKTKENSVICEIENLKLENCKYKDEIESLKKQINILIKQDEKKCSVVTEPGSLGNNNLENTLKLEVDILKSTLSEKNKLLKDQQEAVNSFDALLGHYNDLKTRYRTKRAQLETMDAKLKQIKEERDNLKNAYSKELSRNVQDNSSFTFHRKDNK